MSRRLERVVVYVLAQSIRAWCFVTGRGIPS